MTKKERSRVKKVTRHKKKKAHANRHKGAERKKMKGIVSFSRSRKRRKK